MLHGKKATAEEIVYDALSIVGERTGRPPVEVLDEADHRADPEPRGQVPPRRRRHLPGADRGPGPPRPHPRGPLARLLRPQPQREVDVRATRPRDHGRDLSSRAAPGSGRTTSSVWRRPTRPSPTTAGSAPARSSRRASASACLVGRGGLVSDSSCSSVIVASAPPDRARPRAPSSLEPEAALGDCLGVDERLAGVVEGADLAGVGQVDDEEDQEGDHAHRPRHRAPPVASPPRRRPGSEASRSRTTMNMAFPCWSRAVTLFERLGAGRRELEHRS